MMGSPEDRAKLRKIIDDQFVNNFNGKAFMTEYQMFTFILRFINSQPGGTGPLPSILVVDAHIAINEVIQEAIDDGSLVYITFQHPLDNGPQKMIFPKGTKFFS